MLSPSEMHSLFAGLDLASGGAGHCGSVQSARNPPPNADQFTLPLELAADEQAGLQGWQVAFSEHWKETWPESIRNRWSIRNISCKVTRLRDFIAANVDRHRFQMATANTEFMHWLTFDNRLIAAHLDALLGANDTDPTSGEHRMWGPLEHQLTGRLVNGISDSLLPALPGATRSGWKISAVDSAEEWLAGLPVFLSCELVEFDLEISCSGSAGRFNIGIPRAIVSRYLDSRSSFAASPARSITGSSGESESLRATLNPISLSQADFNQLEVGDVLLTGDGAQAICQVSLNGQPKFQATIGSHQGHKAIRLVADTQ